MSSDTFFISDLHLFHQNILQFKETRPFHDVDHMHQHIINTWNAKVPKTATVYHLGDISFLKGSDQTPLYNILNNLNGKITFLKGNHDHDKKIKAYNEAIENGNLRDDLVFEYTPYKEIKVNKEMIVLCHYPIVDWNRQRYGSIHLHGHCHGTLNLSLDNMMDVGYDPLTKIGIKGPISFEEVRGFFNG